MAETPPARTGFFDWLRSLGVQRDEGWLGGVSSGIAHRIGIDPLIVRGVLVVAAVLGAPALLLYAAAWLLLPDRFGIIHLESLRYGRFTSAMAGILALFVLSMLPLTPLVWWLGSGYWGPPVVTGTYFGRIVLTLMLVAATVLLVVWLAKRSTTPNGHPDAGSRPAASEPSPGTAWAMPAAAAATTHPADESSTGTTGSSTAGATAGTPTAPATESAIPAPPMPEPLGAEADPEEVAAWKLQHQQWKHDYDQWRREQADARRLAQAEQMRRAAATSAEQRHNAELRRRSKPRLSAGWFFTLLGAALVAGGVAAFTVRGTENAYQGVLLGFGVATIVLASGMIVAALARRRSGILALVTVAGLLVTTGAAVLPAGFKHYPLLGSFFTTSSSEEGTAQLAGYTSLRLDAENLPSTEMPAQQRIWQLAGTIDIHIPADLKVRVDVEQNAGTAALTEYRIISEPGDDGEPVYLGMEGHSTDIHEGINGRSSITVGPESAELDVIVTVWQGFGRVNIYDRSQEQRFDELWEEQELALQLGYQVCFVFDGESRYGADTCFTSSREVENFKKNTGLQWWCTAEHREPRPDGREYCFDREERLQEVL